MVPNKELDPVPLWTGDRKRKSLAAKGVRTPNRLALNESLYRVWYPGLSFVNQSRFLITTPLTSLLNARMACTMNDSKLVLISKQLIVMTYMGNRG